MIEFKNYTERRNYSDAHLDAVKTALGRKFITVSNFKQDTRLGYDLIVLNHNFAVRVRQMKYANYCDFTLRTSGGGNRSEYAKLLSPTAPDYLIYGYSLDKNTMAAAYAINLKQWKMSLLNGEIRPMFRRNRDGSHFVAFLFRTPKGLMDYVEQII